MRGSKLILFLLLFAGNFVHATEFVGKLVESNEAELIKNRIQFEVGGTIWGKKCLVQNAVTHLSNDFYVHQLCLSNLKSNECTYLDPFTGNTEENAVVNVYRSADGTIMVESFVGTFICDRHF